MVFIPKKDMLERDGVSLHQGQQLGPSSLRVPPREKEKGGRGCDVGMLQLCPLSSSSETVPCNTPTSPAGAGWVTTPVQPRVPPHCQSPASPLLPAFGLPMPPEPALGFTSPTPQLALLCPPGGAQKVWSQL